MGSLARGLGKKKTAPQATVASKQIGEHTLCFVSSTVLSPRWGGAVTLSSPHPSLLWRQPVDQQGEPVRVALNCRVDQRLARVTCIRRVHPRSTLLLQYCPHRQQLGPPAPLVPPWPPFLEKGVSTAGAPTVWCYGPLSSSVLPQPSFLRTFRKRTCSVLRWRVNHINVTGIL